MNEEYITFYINERKFTTKLVSNVKSQNKIYYYIINESEDIINLILIENDITEIIKGDNEKNLIMIDLKDSDISLKGKIKQILRKIKEKYLNKAIASYKTKCK